MNTFRAFKPYILTKNTLEQFEHLIRSTLYMYGTTARSEGTVKSAATKRCNKELSDFSSPKVKGNYWWRRADHGCLLTRAGQAAAGGGTCLPSPTADRKPTVQLTNLPARLAERTITDDTTSISAGQTPLNASKSLD